MKRIFLRMLSIGGLVKVTNPPLTLTINPDDSANDIKQKIELISAYNDVSRKHHKALSRHKMIAVMFYTLLCFIVLAMIWSGWVYMFSSDPSLNEKANFIFSTIASAAVASLIGMIATLSADD